MIEKDRALLPYWGRRDPSKEAELARRHRTYTRAARVEVQGRDASRKKKHMELAYKPDFVRKNTHYFLQNIDTF